MALCFLAINCHGLINQAICQQSHPVKVEVRKVNNSYKLYRGGQPYFIKGAGGTSYSDRLVKYGGNSIRTWDSRNGAQILNNAQQLGLTVTMGLDVARERHGSISSTSKRASVKSWANLPT